MGDSKAEVWIAVALGQVVFLGMIYGVYASSASLQQRYLGFWSFFFNAFGVYYLFCLVWMIVGILYGHYKGRGS